MTSELKIIKMSDAAAKKLAETFIGWARPHIDGTYSAEDGRPGEEYVRDELARILQDRKVHRIEATAFYDILNVISRWDDLLSEDEISPSAFEDLSPADFSDQFAFDKFGFFATVGGRLALFENLTAASAQDISSELDIAEEYLEIHIGHALSFLQELSSDMASGWHFASAENFLGFSSFANAEGKVNTEFEFEGVQRYLDYLSKVMEGLRVFKDAFNSGTVETNDIAVRTFLDSPVAKQVSLDAFENYVWPVKTRATECSEGLIAKAVECGSARFAIQLSKIMEDEHGGSESFSSELYGHGIDPLLQGPVTDFANGIASAKGIAILLGSEVAGAVLAVTGVGVLVLAVLKKLLGRLTYLLPGVPLFIVRAGDSMAKAFAKISAQLGLELGKFGLAGRIGEMAGGEVAGEDASNIAMTLSVVNGSVISTVDSGIARTLREGRRSLYARAMAHPPPGSAVSYTDSQVRQVVSGMAAWNPHRNLRLTKTTSEKELKVLLRRFRIQVSDSKELEAMVRASFDDIMSVERRYPGLMSCELLEKARLLRASASITGAALGKKADELAGLALQAEEMAKKWGHTRAVLQEIRKLKKVRPEAVADELVERAKLLSGGKTPPASMTLDEVEKELRELRRRAALQANPPERGDRAWFRIPESKGGKGQKGTGAGRKRPAAAATPTGKKRQHTPAEVAGRKFPELQRLAEHPPVAFTPADIARLTEGRVAFSNAALADAMEIYRTAEALRVPFWRRVWELAGGNLKARGLKWKGQTGIWKGQVGHRWGDDHRIVAELGQDGKYTVTSIIKRQGGWRKRDVRVARARNG